MINRLLKKFWGRPPARASTLGILIHLKKMNFLPQTVIDVGAAFGDWSKSCSRFFPEANYLLIEPLKEFELALKETAASLKNGEYLLAALTGNLEEKQALINIHKDLVGSSFFREEEGPAVDGEPRLVPAFSLDEVVVSRGLLPPFFLKIDAQGAERQVLEGASRLLKERLVVILEISLIASLRGVPIFAEMITFMKERGLVVYDFGSFNYRPLDNALSQMDVIFVRDDDPLRQDQRYATGEQREKQNEIRQSFFSKHP